MLIKNMFAPEESKGITTQCIACKLHSKCKNPQMGVVGQGKFGVLIIGEAPSKSADNSGKLLSGSGISLLKERLSQRGLRLEEDFWYTTALQCRFTGKEPSEKQLAMCRDNLVSTIKDLNPYHIWTVGNTATKALLGHALKKVSITSLCGRNIPLHEYDCWVTPLLDPNMVSKRERDKNLNSYFDRQLYQAIGFVKDDLDLPYLNPFENITVLKDPKKIVDTIHSIIDSNVESSFDIESTGLDPWYPGHMTTTMGIATDETAYAFPIEHPEAEFTDKEISSIEDAIVEYIETKHLTKIGHHVNFDIRWFEWLLGAVPEGTFPCTMTTQHIIDHRIGNLSLKDLAFINWGIVHYDKATDGYIKRVPGTHFNRMHKMPLNEQLMYVGADVRITLKLHREQRTRLSEGTKKADDFFRDMLVPLRDLSNNGIHVDVKWYEEKTKELDEEIAVIEYELEHNKDAERFERIYKEPFKYTSPNHLTKLLFDMLKIESVSETEGGAKAVDENALIKIDYWMCPKILEVRKLTKLRDTYIKQYIRNEHDGMVHPDLRLDTARSMRSSCLDPNAHNTPKRNLKSKTIIRTGFIAPPHMEMFEADYSGAEVSTSAMYHKDPTFINYLVTPGTDMHRDNACDIWCTIPDEIVKMIRFYIKNMWTFPQFYGDYFGSCAPQLWETCIEELNLCLASGMSLRDNLADHGIITLKQFTDHCAEQERKLWEERFPVYTEWKKDINDFYIKYGYVETYLGFKFTGLLDKKQTANYPIQGTAFHLLMWALWRVNDIAKRDKWKSKLSLEIHDSIVGYSVPDEREMIIRTMKKVCTEEIRDRFPFINVPLSIEMEFSELGGNFANLTKVEV